MLLGVAAHAASTKDTLGWKWFIYMTNQVNQLYDRSIVDGALVIR
jgi:hypothetical protein